MAEEGALLACTVMVILSTWLELFCRKLLVNINVWVNKAYVVQMWISEFKYIKSPMLFLFCNPSARMARREEETEGLLKLADQLLGIYRRKLGGRWRLPSKVIYSESHTLCNTLTYTHIHIHTQRETDTHMHAHSHTQRDNTQYK